MIKREPRDSTKQIGGLRDILQRQEELPGMHEQFFWGFAAISTKGICAKAAVPLNRCEPQQYRTGPAKKRTFVGGPSLKGEIVTNNLSIAINRHIQVSSD